MNKRLSVLLILVVALCLCWTPPLTIKWMAIGDSITYLNDHPDETGNRVEKGYMTRVVEQLPGIEYVNKGYNGWTAARIAEKIDELGLEKAGIYTVFLGTNDWWNGTPAGAIDDYVNGTGHGTVYGAFRIIIDKLKSLNPKARIILMTPLQRGDFVHIANYANKAYGSYREKNGQQLADIVEAIKTIAQHEQLTFIDLYHKSGIELKNMVKFKRLKDPATGIYRNFTYPEYTDIPFDPNNDEYPYPVEAIDMTYDGLHPSDRGNAAIAEMLVKELISGSDSNFSSLKEIIPASRIEEYVNRFNGTDNELYAQLIPNSGAAEFLSANIPRFECPDRELEEIYYFRWWTYRKHIRQTPDGYVISEFLPPVSWAGKYNGISCAAMHHYNEGRWLRHAGDYLDSYARYWLRGGGSLRTYSFPVAHALYSYYLATGSDSLLLEFLPDLIANYEAWEKERRDPNGLFWQYDGNDGMEMSAAGAILKRNDHYRATIQSYMFADARAISLIASRAGKPELAERFRREAERIRNLLHDKLWDAEAGFYKVAPRVNSPRQALSLVGVRELHGYTPWYIEALQPPAEYAVAWEQLFDTLGFDAPFGPTTTEQRSPYFQISYEGHECQWNGPSWPFSTSVVLTALANRLNSDEKERHITNADYFNCLKRYVHSHRLTREDGTSVPWIDENLNPHTGDWIARTRLKTWENGTWSEGKGGRERGKDYNHSTFCDLIITGLIGVRPQEGDSLRVNPLIPPDAWTYFCLENVPCKGRLLTVLYDRDGTKYRHGAGMRIYVDGELKAHSPGVEKQTIYLK